MSKVRRYSCGFMFDKRQNVILVQKLKPSWQAFKLNGIGGLTEEGETQTECMNREWKEETGDDTVDWEQMFSLRFDEAIVTFFRRFVDEFPKINPTTDTGEIISVVNTVNLPYNVIPNLRWIIPLLLDKDAGGLTTSWMR